MSIDPSSGAIESRVRWLRLVIHGVGIVSLAACARAGDVEIPDGQTVFLRVANVTYEVPLHHHPTADGWSENEALYGRILDGEGVDGNPIVVTDFSLLLEPTSQPDDGSVYLDVMNMGTVNAINIFSCRNESFINLDIFHKDLLGRY